MRAPVEGAAAPISTLRASWTRTVDRSTSAPTLVVYEDKESATLTRSSRRSSRASRPGDRYRSTVALIPVADLRDYDFWPVRGS
jgi:hypothetical protein